jgi:CRP-like cAMP-binding protein
MAIEPQKVRANEVLFKEGDASSCMYIVKKGALSIRKRKGDRYVELGRAYTNEVIGELAFFDRQPRSASAVALMEVEIIIVPFDGLDKVYAGIPDYWKAIFQAVANRLRKSNHVVAELQKGRFDSIEYPSEAPPPSEEMESLEAVLDQAKAAQDAAPSSSDTKKDTKS